MKIVRVTGPRSRPSVDMYELTNEELPAGRVSLGRLGAIHSVRLRVRQRYFLTHDQRLVQFDQASEGKAIDELIHDKTVRHFEYWHYPHSNPPQAEKIVRRLTDSTAIINPLRVDQEWFIKVFARGYATIGAAAAEQIPTIINRALKDFRKTFEVNRQGPWHEILLGKSNVWRRVVRTYTMEYQLPYSQLWPAFDEYVDSIEKAKRDWHVYAAPPTQVRFSQPSRRSLLTHLTHDPTVSFSVSFFTNHSGAHTWLPDLERRFIKYGGRPHWGKMYYVTPEETDNSKMFESIRQKLDPSGTFSFLQGPYTPDPEAFQKF
jgi:hypothetical protein